MSFDKRFYWAEHKEPTHHDYKCILMHNATAGCGVAGYVRVPFDHGGVKCSLELDVHCFTADELSCFVEKLREIDSHSEARRESYLVKYEQDYQTQREESK